MTILPRPDVGFVLASLRSDAGAVRAREEAAARVDDWAAVARLSASHDLDWWVARALPAEVQHAARDDGRAVFLARALAARLTLAGDPPDVGSESTVRYDLQWLEGTRAKLRYLALSAVLPTPEERKMARLPDALLPLAYPLRAWRLLRRVSGRRAS